MRIAQVSPLYETTPPAMYGGTERVVAYLTDALVDLGHNVTLFSCGGSATKGRLVEVRDQAIRLDPAPLKSDLAAHMSMLHEVRRQADYFDILHFHVDILHFPIFEPFAAHTVTTLHGRLDLKDLPEIYACWPQYPLVSISTNQRRPLALANWAATVQHGLPRDLLTANQKPGDYLAFLGRISPEKRPDRAISLARRAGMPLKIAAKVDVVDTAYYQSAIAPLIAEADVEFVGEINDTQKSPFLGNAAALLFPIDWPEPFGLVMIEAMACGTPVIAWRAGSVPEVIDDGVTGFIVDSEEEALAAIRKLPTLDRRRIREVFEKRFSAEVMARRYVTVYERLLSEARPARALHAL